MSRLLRPATAWVLLGAFVALLLAISWRRWGNPISDPGLDLTVAAGWLDGTLPYRDTRYFYGPLGIAGLAGSFAVFGTSLWGAWIFGLLQTAVIAELWRRLARHWLPPVVALAGVAVVLAIGFSGSLFNFQLPHTASATTGLIALLAVLLAITARRYALAGLAIGAAALTRPEFLAFALAALGGAVLGVWREAGLRAAVRVLLAPVPGALLVAGPVLGYFALEAGARELFLENLFPVDFVRAAGGTFERDWHPYDLPSLGTLLLRGVVVAGGVLALLRAIEAWSGATDAGLGRGPAARLAAAPLIVFAAVAVLAALVATTLAAVGGDAGEPLRLLVDDVTRLLLPMTALPAIALTVLVVTALRWWRREDSPLGGATPADLALAGVAAACTLRAYAAFSTDVYATYYAPPAVLVAAIVLHRAAARLGPRRVLTSAGVLALAALVLSAHAWVGRYRDDTHTVRAERGTYVAETTAGPQVQGVIDLLAPRIQAGEPMLVLPQEPGFHFLLGTTPALFNATFLPGTLAGEEATAVRQLAERRPRFVIEAARRFEAWGFRESGVDFNRELDAAVQRDYCVLARFGDTARPPASDLPAQAYTVYARLPAGAAAAPAAPCTP